MATDYDEPRHTAPDNAVVNSLEELQERRTAAQSPPVDVDEADTAEAFRRRLRAARGGPVREGTLGAGRAETSRRVHLLDLFPRPPPTPLRRRTRRPADLPRLCCLIWHPTDPSPASTARPPQVPRR